MTQELNEMEAVGEKIAWGNETSIDVSLNIQVQRNHNPKKHRYHQKPSLGSHQLSVVRISILFNHAKLMTAVK